jgi:hypothetical protein
MTVEIRGDNRMTGHSMSCAPSSACGAELGDDATFADELESIPQTYRAKRKFIKLLKAFG